MSASDFASSAPQPYPHAAEGPMPSFDEAHRGANARLVGAQAALAKTLRQQRKVLLNTLFSLIAVSEYSQHTIVDTQQEWMMRLGDDADDEDEDEDEEQEQERGRQVYLYVGTKTEGDPRAWRIELVAHLFDAGDAGDVSDASEGMEDRSLLVRLYYEEFTYHESFIAGGGSANPWLNCVGAIDGMRSAQRLVDVLEDVEQLTNAEVYKSWGRSHGVCASERRPAE
jgi:hypothetical protein